MDLASLMPRYPGVRLATEADNDRILAFFHRHAMDGSGLAIGYRRGPDFGKLLTYQGPRRITLLFESPKGELTGLGAATFRPGLVDGKRVTVGYLGDLRMAADPRALVQWRRIIADLVRFSPELEETGHCRHFLTAVLDRNAAAQAALVRHRRGGFHYRELARYDVSYVLARLPWQRRPRHGDLRAEWLGERDEADLVRFLATAERDRPFGLQVAEHELRFRLATWDGLSLASFVVVRDGAGRIVAAAAPWSPRGAKSIVIERMPWTLKALRGAGNLLRGAAAPLPREGEELNALYLTHLRFAPELAGAETHKAFRVLLDATIARHLAPGGSPWHVVGFSDYATERLAPALGGYLCYREPATLYSVEGHAPTPQPPRPSSRSAPSFEMALV